MKRKICIIGGGIVGTSIAFHLRESESVECALFEKGDLGSGTSSDSIGGFLLGEMAGINLPLVHTKGQILVVKPKEEIDPPIPMALFMPQGGYLRDEVGGKIIVGKQVYDLKMKLKLASLIQIIPLGKLEPYFKEFVAREMSSKLPFLSDAEILNEWVGYRAVTPDFVPIIDYSLIKGFLLSAGYSGRGIMLAPMGGWMTAQLVAEKPIPRHRKKFQLNRFYY